MTSSAERSLWRSTPSTSPLWHQAARRSSPVGGLPLWAGRQGRSRVFRGRGELRDRRGPAPDIGQATVGDTVGDVGGMSVVCRWGLTPWRHDANRQEPQRRKRRRLRTGAGQALRRDQGTGRRGPGRPRGHRDGCARTERRRQDHPRTHPVHPPLPRLRAGERRRLRRHTAAAAAAPGDRSHRSVRLRRREAPRLGEPLHDRPAPRPAAQGRPAPAPTNCWSASRSPTPPSGRRARTPEACGGASTWPPR